MNVRFVFGASPSYEQALSSCLHLSKSSFVRLSIQQYWAFPLAQLICAMRSRSYLWITRESAVKPDVVWFLDLPDQKESFNESLARSAVSVLQIAESPRKKSFEWSAYISSQFNYVLNYSSVASSNSDIKYRLPFSSYVDNGVFLDLPVFSDRRHCCLINTKRDPTLNMRLSAVYQQYRSRVANEEWSPCIWPAGLLKSKTDDLFSIDDFVSFASNNKLMSFDLYGRGWDRTNGKLGFLPSRKPPACLVSDHDFYSSGLGAKFDILMKYRFSIICENTSGDFDYVSEKIFDSLIAGCIPLYAGDNKFADRHDGEILFSLRRFDRFSDLEAFIVGFDYGKWLKMSQKCIDFAMHSSYSQRNRCDDFVNTALSLLDSLASG